MNVPLVRTALRGDERFAVTGASGWLGRTTLDLLARTLGPEEFTERVTGFASADRDVQLRNGFTVPVRPLSSLLALDPPPTHLLHFACLTRDRVAAMGTPAYVLENMRITTLVLDALQAHRPSGVLFSSSGAVYSPDGAFAADIDGNAYGSLKYHDELALRRAACDIGARSVVTRVFSVAGAYMTKPEKYVLGDLVLRALAGSPLVVRARGPVHRSYCAAVDLVTLGLLRLLSGGGSNDIVFDSGGTAVEVGELAASVRNALGLPHLAIDRSFDADAAPERYVGDVEGMAALASSYGLQLAPLETQILDTAAFLR